MGIGMYGLGYWMEPGLYTNIKMIVMRKGKKVGLTVSGLLALCYLDQSVRNRGCMQGPGCIHTRLGVYRSFACMRECTYGLVSRRLHSYRHICTHISTRHHHSAPLLGRPAPPGGPVCGGACGLVLHGCQPKLHQFLRQVLLHLHLHGAGTHSR